MTLRQDFSWQRSQQIAPMKSERRLQEQAEHSGDGKPRHSAKGAASFAAFFDGLWTTRKFALESLAVIREKLVSARLNGADFRPFTSDSNDSDRCRPWRDSYHLRKNELGNQ